MIPSAYKNRFIPHKAQLCAICQLRTRRSAPAQLVQLTFGVTVWLCPMHASEEFMTMRGGKDFALTLTRSWLAAGCYTRARDRALTAHLERLDRDRTRRQRPERALPGSYHWKALRNETEHRAAAGEALATIIRDLRARHAHDYADAPSERTFRRWYTDRRWARGVRTPVRRGFERRDTAHARRAQIERAHARRLREAAPLPPASTGMAGTGHPAPAPPAARGHPPPRR